MPGGDRAALAAPATAMTLSRATFLPGSSSADPTAAPDDAASDADRQVSVGRASGWLERSGPADHVDATVSGEIAG